MNILALVVMDLMRRKGENLTFVQIGAHDGKHLDPIYPFVGKYHWKGLLVEPQSRVFAKLLENYANEPQLTFECCAICDAKTEYVWLNAFDNPALPEHASMLSSFIPAALSNNRHGYQGGETRIAVAAMSLAALLAKHEVRDFDIFQVDCEGYDKQIIEMLLKTSIRPSVINWESAFYGNEQLGEIAGMLLEAGYESLMTGVDTISVYRPVDEFPRVAYADCEAK